MSSQHEGNLPPQGEEFAGPQLVETINWLVVVLKPCLLVWGAAPAMAGKHPLPFLLPVTTTHNQPQPAATQIYQGQE